VYLPRIEDIRVKKKATKKIPMRVIQSPPRRGKLTAKQCRDAVRAVMEPEIVQVLNPRSQRYVKINRTTGTIISVKKTPGAYKNVKVVK